MRLNLCLEQERLISPRPVANFESKAPGMTDTIPELKISPSQWHLGTGQPPKVDITMAKIRSAQILPPGHLQSPLFNFIPVEVHLDIYRRTLPGSEMALQLHSPVDGSRVAIFSALADATRSTSSYLPARRSAPKRSLSTFRRPLYGMKKDFSARIPLSASLILPSSISSI